MIYGFGIPVNPMRIDPMRLEGTNDGDGKEFLITGRNVSELRTKS
jgi:hypothetical protein